MPIVRTTPASGGFPTGHDVELTGRGATFVREVPGPANAPVLIALHGWTASADLNWYPCYSAFGEHFRVLAPDLRGHSRGLRTRSRFRLEDCADDVVALADEFGVESFYVVGYSMGGTVALAGFAKSQAKKDRAGELARGTKGVKEVRNNLIVRPGTP